MTAAFLGRDRSVDAKSRTSPSFTLSIAAAQLRWCPLATHEHLNAADVQELTAIYRALGHLESAILVSRQEPAGAINRARPLTTVGSSIPASRQHELPVAACTPRGPKSQAHGMRTRRTQRDESWKK